MCSFESELYPSDLWGNSMLSFEFELCHSNLWEEMAYSLLCLDRLDRKFEIYSKCVSMHTFIRGYHSGFVLFNL